MFKWHLFFLTFILNITFIHAQCDYSKVKYAVTAELDVVYGVQNKWDGKPDTLRLDIYKPVGDGNIKRPVVVFIHGGGFAQGSRKDLGLLCNKYASQGMVCVTISYRLGFIRPLAFDYPYTLDPSEVLRASYRGQQDAKAAIRFMKARNGKDSTDLENYYAVGFSAGAFIAMAVGYAEDSIYKPAACRSIADGTNLNGTFKRPDLGPINGTLNINGYDARIQGVFNFFGAVNDTNMIRDNGTKLFQYHQNGDPVVPCGFNRPYHGIGVGIPDNYPYVYGSCVIEQRLKNLDLRAPENVTYIYNGSKHEVHDLQGYEQLMSQKISDWVCTSAANIDNKSENKLSYFPVPVQDIFHIQPAGIHQPGIIEMEIYNARLQKVSQLTSDNQMFDLSMLPTGIYFLKIQGNGFYEFVRIIKS